jgi:hypothetical protein
MSPIRSDTLASMSPIRSDTLASEDGQSDTESVYHTPYSDTRELRESLAFTASRDWALSPLTSVASDGAQSQLGDQPT